MTDTKEMRDAFAADPKLAGFDKTLATGELAQYQLYESLATEATWIGYRAAWTRKPAEQVAGPGVDDNDLSALTMYITMLERLASGEVWALGGTNMLAKSEVKKATMADTKRILPYVIKYLKKLYFKMESHPAPEPVNVPVKWEDRHAADPSVNIHDHKLAELAEWRALAAIWTKVDAIRAKQAAKPKHSPLPESAPQAQPVSDASESACKMCGDTPRITAQRLMLKERFANREPSPATADFDLPPACIEEPPTAPDAGRRDAALEEAAKVCDFHATWSKGEAEESTYSESSQKTFRTQQFQAEKCAGAIRALKTVPAKPQGGTQ